MVSGLSNENKRTQDFDNSEEKESRWEPNPILQIKNRFRSGGLVSSEIICVHLYPNRKFFSIKIMDFGNW
jgi:hypothetical protein